MSTEPPPFPGETSAKPPPFPGESPSKPLVPSPSAPQAIPSSSEERQMAMFAHLGGIIGAFLIPLIIWLIKKDQSKFVDDQGKEALNFQLTMIIGHLVAAVTSFFFIGLFLWPIILVLNLVFCILAGVAANKGEAYRYPFALRLIK